MDLQEMRAQLERWDGEIADKGYWLIEPKFEPYDDSSTPERRAQTGWRIKVYTDVNEYRIYADVREGGDGAGLGCIASSRKKRPGEDWHRGQDLPDGPFSEATWLRIIKSIIRLETVKIHKSDHSVLYIHGTPEQQSAFLAAVEKVDVDCPSVAPKRPQDSASSNPEDLQ